MDPQVSLILPQYNESHLTIACLQSLHTHEPAPLEILVIDDGSHREHRAQIEALPIPSLRLFAQPHAGVTAAWNRAAAAARAPFLIFLNNDTLLHGPVVHRLIEPLQAGKALMTGPALRRETALPPSILQALPTDRFLQGWCFALSCENFRALGGFDESMSLYFSDTDLQARLLREHGRDYTALAPIADLPLTHQAHQTTRRHPRRRRIWQADRETFIRIWTTQ